MSCCNVLEDLLKKGTIEDVLKMSRSENEDVRDFQIIMHQLGFGEALNWASFGADGKYGNSCANAVQDFAELNGIESDGTVVTRELGQLILQRYDALDELQEFEQDLIADWVESIYFKGSHNRGEIGGLQTILNELGYGQELNWDKYQNDGFYGDSTVDAIEAFMNDEGLDGDPENLPTEVAIKILEKLAAFYGPTWYENAKDETSTEDSTEVHESRFANDSENLVYYEASNFVGKRVKADVLFVPALDRINEIAQVNNVLIHVTSSLRSSSNVAGAIVTPAKKSNHMAGHAIDMNIRFGPTHTNWANSKYLKKSNEPNWDPAVAGFINDIRQDSNLRWGGDFRAEDPVHIDDHLNKDLDAWEERYHAVQSALQHA